MVTVPQNDVAHNTAWNHVNDLLVEKLRSSIASKKHVDKTKTRLRTMLAAQYSFGVTVGAPVVFFCGSFVYTLVDNMGNLGDNSTSHALGMIRTPRL